MAAPSPILTTIPITTPIPEAGHTLNTGDANNGGRVPDLLLASGDNSGLITLANPLPIVGVGGTPGVPVLHRGVSGGSGVPATPSGVAAGTGGTLATATYFYAATGFYTGGGQTLPSAVSAGVAVTLGQKVTVTCAVGTITPPAGQTLFAYGVYRATTASTADPTQWTYVGGVLVGSPTILDAGTASTTVAILPTVDTSTSSGVVDSSEPSGLASHDTNLVGSVPSGAVGGPGTSWIDWDVSLTPGGNAATFVFMPRKWNARQSLWFNSVLAADAPALTVTALANSVATQTLRVQTLGFWYYLRCTSVAGLGAGFRADAATS